MKVNEVLLKYHSMVPFPLTRTKVKKAGFELGPYLKKLLDEIVKSEDFNPKSKTEKEILNALKELRDSTG